MTSSPILLVVFGIIATGKTTLAEALAQRLGWPVIHSDWVRKTLAGVPLAQRVWEDYGAGIYAPEFSGRTYAEMLRQAREHLEAGRSVILDGSYRRAADRQAVQQLARHCRARVLFVLCSCTAAELRHRLEMRRQDPQAVSDGREELLPRQQQDFEAPAELPPGTLLRLDTGRPLDNVLADSLAAIASTTSEWKGTPMDREATIARVKQRAKDNFKLGLNCAESVFTAILVEQDWGLPPETMCVMSGFGSGGGLYGGTCGSLVGAIAAVGLAYGRRTPPSGPVEEKKAQLYGKPGLYRVFNRISNEFQKRFGTTLCRNITQAWHNDWFCKDRLRTCLGTVTAMAEVAAEMVFPADLAHWGSQPLGDNILGQTD